MNDTITTYLPYAAWCFGGALGGFGICAVLTAGKVADERQAYVDENDFANLNLAAKNEAQLAHARCADALTTTQRKLSAIRDLLDKPRTIRKGELAMILDGEDA